MPVATKVGVVAGHDDDVADTHLDRLVAPRAEVAPAGFVGLHLPHLDVVVVRLDHRPPCCPRGSWWRKTEAMVLETHNFRLVAGADEAAFLDADRRVQTEFIPSQPGFLRRTTARGQEGEWLVVTLWRTGDDATAFTPLAEGHAVHEAFMQFVDPATARGARYTTLD